MQTRQEILDNYYQNFFDLLCNSGGQRKGSDFIHRSIEKYWKIKSPKAILEVGGGDGAHIEYIPQDVCSSLDRIFGLHG